LVDAGSPVGAVTPAHAGVLYRQSDGSGSSRLFIATGTTSADWAVIQTARSGSVPIVDEPSIVYGTNSSGGALNRRAASGERGAGQIPVYGEAGDLVVANTPATTTSAISKTYLDAVVEAFEKQIAALEDRVAALEGP
jgi:hypothetical protein